MKHEEIIDLLNYEDNESKLFVPNEIFDNLKDNIDKSPHIAFSYSYIYLVTWLYRYAKIFTGDNKSVINNNIIKELLGYNPKSQTVNYLIKRKGLLEKIGLLKSVGDFPYTHSYTKEEGLQFEMYSDYKEFHDMHPRIARNHFFRYPVKSLDDRILTTDKELLKGAFYDVSNTHMIPFEVFLYCMSEKEIKREDKVENESVGTIGFYLYAFLKHKTDLHKSDGGYTISVSELSSETGITERTLERYLSILKERNMIEYTHNIDHFVPSLPKHLRIGNTYRTYSYEEFNYSNTPKKYKRINFMSYEEFAKKQAVEKMDLTNLF